MKKLLSAMVCLCMICGMLSACTQKTESTDFPSEPQNSETVGAVGGSGECDVHYEQYHLFPCSLTELANDDSFDFFNWAREIRESGKDIDTDCTEYGINVKTFIDQFQIPREAFEQFCNDYWDCIHNIDLLYSDDLDAIEAYYRDWDARVATHDKQMRLRNTKRLLVENYYHLSDIWAKAEDEKTETEKEVESIDEISMFRLIQLFHVEKAELDAVIEAANEFFRSDYCYNYQLDLVYNPDGTLKDFEIDPAKTVVELDAQFAGVENFFTD